ncbi:phage tail-collar fiber domain-containing protein [Alkalimonas mucilaginosa]|uniref:Phage tail protein n=1 Tax=Alkalimonas mucilaginosa TaxID=3057676 RepID=A0ABU7JD24_9GAMM|nr:phage tail protein [Alkalimonas sp. MEB004]MEE2023596.1 phage tail protein [Alkalimonas sp. MEB004]
MAQVITTAGEQLFALKAQNNEQLDIDTFIFANVPGLDPAEPIDRSEGVPTEHVVHQQIVQQVGRVNQNVVIYSTVLDSVTGPFEFNWVGLFSAVNGTLVAVSHIPTVVKTVTEPGTAGNTLNRNFGIEYSGIADLTGITVDPETWQLDYTARLNGMDELTKQLAKDTGGKDWFKDDGFKVVPREVADSFKILAGAGYVSGLYATLDDDKIINVSSYPQNVYVDAWFDGTASSTWQAQVEFSVTDEELADYIDSNGKQHHLFKLAELINADTVQDLRPAGRINVIERRLGAQAIGVINVSEIINNSPEFILPITPELGQHITLEGHGDANFTITGFGDACPVGYTFSLLIPRTIANTGGNANSLGSYVQFLHTASGNGLDMKINARQSGSSTLYTYQAYPNANDALGRAAALYEQLMFSHLGSGRWRCTSMPQPMSSENQNGLISRFSCGRQRLGYILSSSAASVSEALSLGSDVTINGYGGAVNKLGSRPYPASFVGFRVDQITGGRFNTSTEYIYFEGRDWSQILAKAGANWNFASGMTAVSINLYAEGSWKPNV